MSITGYQSDASNNNGATENKQQLLNLPINHINPNLEYSPFRNIYTVINGNLIVGKDIRLRAKDIKQEIVGWQVSLPAPLDQDLRGEHTGTLLSVNGSAFFYAIDNDGKVFLNGKFDSINDEVILNINPYLAELPLRFISFPDPKAPKK
ncbi:hypothetical protein [Winogradskyella forsetii]|uniref:hypothetical protein n=1 Tax=Winogradskyella forsetii TaxID=2686077 RepID=UPI0015B96EEF|nr:hypothetical protein [Winogradskyella forsetii]